MAVWRRAELKAGVYDEIVSARLRSSGVVNRIKVQRSSSSARAMTKPHDYVETYFERQRARAAIYQREKLAIGGRLRTPCIIVEYSATTIVPGAAVAEAA